MSRIRNLPRRVWSESAESLVRTMTELCRTPNGTMTLRPIQAACLLEASELGGVLANARTGAGKTILSGLLPYVLNAERPMLFVPANLKNKTHVEFKELRKHWKIPKNIRIESYEKLAQAKHENMLVDYKPDLIVCDEAQALKHVEVSARARRIARYMAYFGQNCKLCAMTATLGEIDEFAHILLWALGDGAPVPNDPDEIRMWAKVLNRKVQDFEREDPEILVPHLGPEALDGPRAAFRDRLNHTPGVIVSVDSFDACGLVVRPRYVDPAPEIEKAFGDLRLAWTMPDGWDLADAALEVWQSARQLALGVYKMHDPRPPNPWRDVRRQYCAAVRKIIEISEQYDTELQVREAFESGALPSWPYRPKTGIDQITGKTIAQCAHEAGLYRNVGDGESIMTLWEAWVKIRDTYQPKEYPVWLSESVIDDAIAWGRSSAGGRDGGIIWVDNVDFGTRLAEKSGWPYFRHMGRDQRKRLIEGPSVGKTECVICSIESNKTGRNLQHKWHRNLIVDPPNKGDDWEQLISRTHREGQLKDTVFVDYMITCYEYYNSPYQALNDNEGDNETIGQNYRLLKGDVIMPTLVGRKGEHVWDRSDKKNKVVVI